MWWDRLRSLRFSGPTFALLVMFVSTFMILRRWLNRRLAVSLKKRALDIVALADVRVNSKQPRPWDPTVHNEATFSIVLREGTLGLGESYMAGWWDCPAIDQLIYRMLRARLDEKVQLNWRTIATFVGARLFINFQSPARSFEVADRHYNIGNQLFQAMLDRRLIYSCAYWKNATTLDDAQEHKLELICQKLRLRPGQRVLDIGCGWGGFGLYAAQKYGVTVVGITVSTEQVKLAQEICKGFPVEIRLQDYRRLDPAVDKFDRIVSVGMFEHVGVDNYRTFFRIAHSVLNDDGLFLLHSIGDNVTTLVPDPWMTKYIFPNSILPSIKNVGAAIERLFVMEDWHNFGTDYDKTLMAWWANFDRAWPQLKSHYDERFYRMWKYYLLSCAGLFRARNMQLWQIVLSKGIEGGYESIRP